MAAADRPGLQYPTIQADPKASAAFKSSLDSAFKNYGDNLRWLTGMVDSLQSAINSFKTEGGDSKSADSEEPTSGAYLPTAIPGVNVTDALASEAQWMRVGDVVGVSGVLVVTPTSTGSCNTDLTLPFAAQLTDLAKLAGTADQENGIDHGSVLGNTLTFNANVEWRATSTSAYNLAYIYLYQTVSHVLTVGTGGGGGGGGAGITQLTGDVTAGPGSGSVAATIANDAVTYAKFQNVGANEYLGRAANSSGNVSGVAIGASQLAGRGDSGDLAAIGLGAGLSMSGTTMTSTGGTAWTQLSRQVLGSDTATVSFTSISGAYNHLKLFVTARDTVSAVATTTLMRFNNDSTANYDYQIWYGVTGTNATDTASFGQTSGAVAVIPGATSTRASSRGQIEIFIPDYATTTFEKSAFGLNASTAGASVLYNLTSTVQWRNTAAITRIDFLATTAFKTGSIFTLYGIL